jgi:hypothetical protein
VPGCSAAGENPRAVLVAPGETRRAEFVVTCGAELSVLEVRTHTTGIEPFPTGYKVALDGNTPRTIGVHGTLTIPDLEPGDHLVLLTGLGTDCGVAGSNPLTLQLAPNATARAEFTVACFASRGASGSRR